MHRPYFIKLDDRYRVTSRGSMANGAGLSDPINRTLDDWCQYTAHHFCPGGMNPAGGIIMDTSHRISYASIWGMVLLHVLHPTGAKNYYGRYLAGIIFRPRFYSDYIRWWNQDHPDEIPIAVATGAPTLRRMMFNAAPKNLSKLDVIRHLAAYTITQEMLDNAYPWAQAWIDQHLTIHF